MRRALVLLLLAGCPPSDPPMDAGTSCRTLSDCGQPGPCEQVACASGTCRRTLIPSGTSVGTQTAGDCKRRACDSSGQIVTLDDDNDVPNDGNDCTADRCAQGTASHPTLDAGTACGMGLQLRCNGAGVCSGCRNAADCPMPAECRTATCVNAECGTTDRAQGTRLMQQTAGDCRARQCNGQGAEETVNDDSDVPNDQNACTIDGCMNGQPSHPPVAAGGACADGGTLCDGMGACRQCLSPADCSGMDTECRARTCSGGVCGVRNTDAGTAVASQTSGDCRRQVCDGLGAVTAAADDADLPNDNNACTANACDAGAPWFPPLDAGTPCGASSVCSAAGQCVGCNQPSDCGVNDACKTFLCSGGGCGVMFATAGTVVGDPMPGDCKRDVCDMQGNIVAANHDADVPPDDGNACTGETCSNGVPQHPGLMTNTPCDGGFCSPMSQCVECNAPSQCPGSDTDCRLRACVAGRCGFTLLDAGIVTPSQQAGDCRQNQCDGDGGVTAAIFDTDLPPDDNVQCTRDECMSGAPVHPPQPMNTACSQNGGAVCNASGACVQCNVGSQCASMVCSMSICQAPTCTDGVRNGSETAVDCGGGTCPGCGPGLACLAHGDCSGGACNPMGNVCAPTCTTSEAPGATCASYCACMAMACASKFPTMAACLDACATRAESAVCCRAYHCEASRTAPATHCPHAAGEAVCQ